MGQCQQQKELGERSRVEGQGDGGEEQAAVGAESSPNQVCKKILSGNLMLLKPIKNQNGKQSKGPAVRKDSPVGFICSPLHISTSLDLFIASREKDIGKNSSTVTGRRAGLNTPRDAPLGEMSRWPYRKHVKKQSAARPSVRLGLRCCGGSEPF